MDHLYSNCQRVPRLGLTPTSSPKVRPLCRPCLAVEMRRVTGVLVLSFCVVLCPPRAPQGLYGGGYKEWIMHIMSCSQTSPHYGLL